MQLSIDTTKPFETIVYMDEQSTLCPCGARIISDESHRIHRFIQAHLHHSNGKIHEVLTAESAKLISFDGKTEQTYDYKPPLIELTDK